MAVVYPQVGLDELLARMLSPGSASGDPWVLHLFQNDYQPHISTVVGEFVESTFAGYATRTVSQSGWVPQDPTVNAAHSRYGDAPWVWDSLVDTQSIFGWYVTNGAGDVVYMAERLPMPRIIEPTRNFQLQITSSMSGEFAPPP